MVQAHGVCVRGAHPTNPTMQVHLTRLPSVKTKWNLAGPGGIPHPWLWWISYTHCWNAGPRLPKCRQDPIGHTHTHIKVI